MKLENQVVSLERAKELRGNGYKQEGLFWYVVKESSLTKKPVGSLWYWKEKGFSGQEICVAPTVAELGEALPDMIENTGYKCYLRILKKKNFYYVNYLADNSRFPLHRETDNILATALAKMWLYLKKKLK